jgi:hypothetical protein
VLNVIYPLIATYRFLVSYFFKGHMMAEKNPKEFNIGLLGALERFATPSGNSHGALFMSKL